VIAEYLGGASVTDEFLDRWRTPGERRSKTWEERFGRPATSRWAAGLGTALKSVGISAEQVDAVAVTGMHGRAVKALGRTLGVGDGVLADDLTSTVGQAGSAHVGLVLASMLEQASPGQVLAVVSLADGADVLVFRTTDALADWRPSESVADQVAAGPISPTASSSRGGAWSPPSRRAVPSPSGLVLGRLAQ